MSSMSIAPKLVKHTTVSSSSSLNIDASKFNVVDVVLTEASELMPPTNQINGSKVEWRIKASGANRDVTINTDIIIPSSATVTSPVTINDGDTTLFMLEYNESLAKWMLIAYIEGY